MATGACEKYGADYGLSATGFAGPSGSSQVNLWEPFTSVMPPIEYGQKN